MQGKKCKNCDRYIQHYAFLEGKFRPVFCGHCLERKHKNIKPHTAACDSFVFGEPLESQFVTKQYLTKALLQHVLTMELWEES